MRLDIEQNISFVAWVLTKAYTLSVVSSFIHYTKSMAYTRCVVSENAYLRKSIKVE